MEHDTALQFGEYLKQVRQEHRLGIRELARKADVDAGGLTRLEQGKTSPRPETLKALAEALDIPLSDLFARAGYVTPSDLPSMNNYLHLCYGQLPDKALASLNEYIRRLIDKHGLDPNGPADHEDEIEKPQR